MRNFILTITISIFTLLDTFSQEDTLKTKDKIKPKFIFQIDIRNTFIQDNSNYKKLIFGFKMGLDYNKKHLYTFGLYTTNNPFVPLEIIYRKSLTGQIIKQLYNFEMYFASLGYQFVFFNKHKILMSCPIEAGFGLGRAYVERHWIDNGNLDTYSVELYSKFVPVQVGYALEWKPLPWFALTSQVGYRKSFLTDLLNDNKNINYDGVYYTFGIRAYLSRIIKDSKGLIKKRE